MPKKRRDPAPKSPVPATAKPKETPPTSEHEAVEVRHSRIHGTGAFARRAIAKDERFIEYVGEKINKTEAEKRCLDNNEYIFTLDDDWDLDGNVPWNPARFINHSCAPNCEAENDECRIWIFALRDIQPGEELSFNYGYDLENYRDHVCQCGKPDCVGYIVAEEYFDQVRRENKK